jgi:anti-sigma B factor antagonist
VPEGSVVTSSTAVRSRAGPSRFLCRWQRGAFGAAWVSVEGELDLETSPQLWQTLRDAQLNSRLVVLDLREVAFLDSSGVRVILAAARDARCEGGRLMLVRGPAEVDRRFTLTGASDHVLIFDLDPTEPSRTLLESPRGVLSHQRRWRPQGRSHGRALRQVT